MAKWTTDDQIMAQEMVARHKKQKQEQEDPKNRMFTNLLNKLATMKCICCGGPGHEVEH